MNESPQNKAELIAELNTGWQMLEDRLRALSEIQLTTPRTSGDWSIKDHVAHLMAYEQGIVALLRHEPRWEAMQLDRQFVDEAKSFDELNAVLYEHHKDRSAADILAAFRQTHHDLLDALANLTDEDIFKPYIFYQPDDHSPNEQDPVVGWIVGNTYGHYDEHFPWMEELLAQQSVAPAGS